jgi:hypothetical protein
VNPSVVKAMLVAVSSTDALKKEVVLAAMALVLKTATPAAVEAFMRT